jgi:ATP-binding cassette subfamily F protein 2
MPSDRAKKAAALKKAKKDDKLGLKSAASSKSLREDGASPADQAADELAGVSLNGTNGGAAADANAADNGAAGRSVTGVWAAHPQARDIQVDSFTLLFHGHELLADTRLELNFGRRYGLLGPNGCGKSCMLKAIAAREMPIPDHIDMFLVDREIAATDKTALEAVMEVDGEKTRLEAEAEALAEKDMTPEVELRLSDVYER